jgi:hypothetical protein
MMKGFFYASVLCVLLAPVFCWADATSTSMEPSLVLDVSTYSRGESTGSMRIGPISSLENLDVALVCSPVESGGPPTCLLVIVPQTNSAPRDELLAQALGDLPAPPVQAIQFAGLRIYAFFPSDEQLEIRFFEEDADGNVWPGDWLRLSLTH